MSLGQSITEINKPWVCVECSRLSWGSCCMACGAETQPQARQEIPHATVRTFLPVILPFVLAGILFLVAMVRT